MSKLVQALLVGLLITLILDGFIFIGMLVNYINFYEINLFYKPFFDNNQNIYLFILIIIILGTIINYLKNTRLILGVLGTLFILSFSTLIPFVGNTLGEALFMTKNITLQDTKYTYKGDIYYDAKEYLIFYDTEVQKIIKIQKKDLK